VHLPTWANRRLDSYRWGGCRIHKQKGRQPAKGAAVMLARGLTVRAPDTIGTSSTSLCFPPNGQ